MDLQCRSATALAGTIPSILRTTRPYPPHHGGCERLELEIKYPSRSDWTAEGPEERYSLSRGEFAADRGAPRARAHWVASSRLLFGPIPGKGSPAPTLRGSKPKVVRKVSSRRNARETGQNVAPFVWEETIRLIERANGRPPSAMLFNKIVSLTYFRAADQGLELTIPYSWYKYGPEAVVPSSAVRFSSSLGPPPDSPDEDDWEEVPEVVPDRVTTLVEWRGDLGAHDLPETTTALLRRTIEELVSEFAGPGKAELAVDEVYGRAPFTFQQEFRNIRIALGTTGRGSSRQQELQKAGPWPSLNRALDTFPKKSFPEVAEYVAPLRRSFELAWTGGNGKDRNLATELVENFWLAFCAQLRVHKEGHHLVERRVLEAWEEIAELRFERFRRNFGDIVVEIGARHHEALGDPILSPLVEERQTEQEVERRAIDDAGETLLSLDETLGRIHAGR